MTPKILIGYDGSERGEDALALGALLATALDATPLVALAVAYPDHLLSIAELEPTAQAQAAAPLEHAADRLAPLAIETRTLIDDSAGHALHALAETEKPVVIVIGSPHRAALGRVLLGSVGSSLLSGAPCAVAIAPHGYSERTEPTIRRIGVGVDGSAESRAAVHTAGRLAEHLKASLTLIAVAPGPAPDIGGAMLSILSRERMDSLDQAEFTARLDQAAADMPAGLQVKRRLLRGDPASELGEAAKRLDLLVVGSRAYGPLRRTLIGGVSTQLLNSAPGPLLVMPRGKQDALELDQPAEARIRAAL